MTTNSANREERQNVPASSASELQSILDALPEDVLIINPDYSVAVANQSIRAKLDGKDPVAAGMFCYQVSHHRDTPCEGAEHGCPLKKVLESKAPVVLEHIHYDDRGNPLTVEVRGVPVLDDEGQVKQIIETCRDITDRKEAEAKLIAGAQRFRSLAERLPDGVTVHSEGLLRFVNEAAIKTLGGTCAEDFLGKPAMDFIHPDYRETAAGRIKKIYAKSGPVPLIEYKMLRLNGEVFDAEMSAGPIELDGKPASQVVIRDISERKKAERELQESEDTYRTIFEIAGVPMIFFGLDNIINLANKKFEELSGYSHEEIIGKKLWSDFFTGETLAQMKRNHAARTIDPESAPKAYEAQFIDRSGKIHDGIISVDLVPGTQLRIASYQETTELKAAQQQMYRADKMAALGQIIAGVAHEINNPNNFVFFNLPILKQYVDAMRPYLDRAKLEDPELRLCNMPHAEFVEDVYKLIDNMAHGSERITEIVGELKDYVGSRSEEARKPGDISVVIEGVMTLVGKQVRKMVQRLEVEVEEDLPAVNMNAGKIEQVLINLVINAGQAADKEDAWVRLKAGRHPGDPGKLLITVADNGAGIPHEVRSHIFDPFFTTKGRDTGTGLGLAISNRIVEDHGGSIGLDSTPGEGACFTIELPCS